MNMFGSSGENVKFILDQSTAPENNSKKFTKEARHRVPLGKSFIVFFLVYTRSSFSNSGRWMHKLEAQTRDKLEISPDNHLQNQQQKNAAAFLDITLLFTNVCFLKKQISSNLRFKIRDRPKHPKKEAN